MNLLEWLRRTWLFIGLVAGVIGLIGLVAIPLSIDHIGWWVIYFDGKQCS